MTTFAMAPHETAVHSAHSAHTKAAWMAGDFGKLARAYASGAAEFINRLKLGPGDHVLDAACGTGNLAIPAARTGARVSAIDIAPNLIRQAMVRAHSEGLTIHFKEGNVEHMPYASHKFDAVVSMFGAMFASHPEAAASELVRVCRSGGRIAMANWTPDGFVGEMFRIVARYIAPAPVAPGTPSPLLWGVEAKVAERLGRHVTDLRCTPRTITFNLPFDAATTVEYFGAYYGPTARAYAALSPDAKRLLRNELEELWAWHNCGEDGTTEVDSTYLEVVAIRK